MARHNLRRRYGRAAMAAGRVKWRSLGNGAYDAKGLWGEFRIRPPLGPWSKGFVLIWSNIYDYPSDNPAMFQELGSFKTLSAAKKAAQAHIKLLKSTAVG